MRLGDASRRFKDIGERSFRQAECMKIAELLGGAAMEWTVTIEGRDELGEVQALHLNTRRHR